MLRQRVKEYCGGHEAENVGKKKYLLYCSGNNMLKNYAKLAKFDKIGFVRIINSAAQNSRPHIAGAFLFSAFRNQLLKGVEWQRFMNGMTSRMSLRTASCSATVPAWQSIQSSITARFLKQRGSRVRYRTGGKNFRCVQGQLLRASVAAALAGEGRERDAGRPGRTCGNSISTGEVRTDCDSQARAHFTRRGTEAPEANLHVHARVQDRSVA